MLYLSLKGKQSMRISDYEDYIRAMAVELKFIDQVLDLPFDQLKAYVEEEIQYGGKSQDDSGCNIQETYFNEEKYLEDTARAAGYNQEGSIPWYLI
jgi:hypothetical protein